VTKFSRVILVLLGPPGAGKGTQAEMLHEKLNIPHLSTGDILRDAIKKKTEIGKEAYKYMHKGELVPDTLIFDLIENRVSKNDCSKGAIFDGFPRNLEQAKVFLNLNFIEEAEKCYVILIDVPDMEVVKRLSNRRYCPKCQSIYNLINMQPKKIVNGVGFCDKCGTKLEIRDDDKVETIKNRLQVYLKSAKPMLKFFKKKSILQMVHGCKDKNNIYQNILKRLD